MSELPQADKSFEIMHRLAKTSSDLTRCTTFREIIAVIAKNMLSSGQFLSMNLTRYDAAGLFAGFDVMATANRRESFETYESLMMRLDDADLTTRHLFYESVPVLVQDVDKLEDANLRVWLARFGIQAFCGLPLHALGRNLGFLSLNSLSKPLILSETELSAYQSLTDHVSSLIRLYRLAEDTEFSQELNNRVTTTLNQLSIQQDIVEMAQVIARNMLPESGRLLAINHFEYDEAGEINEWRVLATANRNQAFSGEFAPEGTIIRWKDIKPHLRSTVEKSAPFVLRDTLAAAQQTAGDAAYQWFADRGIASFIGLPMAIENKPVGVLSIMSRTLVPFSDVEVSAFRRLTDQISVLIQARALLEDARRADSAATAAQVFATSLVETNQKLLEAKTYADIGSTTIHAMPEFISGVALYLFNRPVQVDEQPEHLVLKVFATRSQVYEPDLIDQPTADKARAAEDIAALYSKQVLVLDYQAESASVLIPTSSAFIRNLENYPAASIGLVGDDKLIGMLVFCAPHTLLPQRQMLGGFSAVASQVALVLQNRQLIQDAQIAAQRLEQRVRVLNLLNDMAAHIVSAQEEQTVLDQTTRAVVEALPADYSTIMLFDAANKMATLVSDYPKQDLTPVQMGLANNPLFEPLLRPNPTYLLVNAAAENPQLDEAQRKILQEMHIYSLLVLPLLIQGKVIGSIGIDLKEPNRGVFTPEMVEVAQTIAVQVSVGLQNVRLLRDAQRRADQLQYIAAFSQSVQATLDEEEIFKVAINESSKMLRIDYMSIVIYDSQRSQLRAVAEYDGGSSWIDKEHGTIIPRLNTPHEHVWDTRTMLHVPDLQEEATLYHPVKRTLRSLMIAPIFSRGLVMGMVEAGCFEPHYYSPTDEAVFLQMVNQLAVAIENAEAYAQSQEMAKNKALANEIATQLQQQMDMESILNVTMNQLGKALGARRGRIRLGTRTTTKQ